MTVTRMDRHTPSVLYPPLPSRGTLREAVDKVVDKVIAKAVDRFEDKQRKGTEA